MTALQKHVVIALLEAGMDINGAETVDGMRSDNMCLADVAEMAKRTGLTMKQVQGVLASSSAWIDTNVEKVNGEKGVDQWLNDWGVQVAFELMAMGVEAKKSKAVDNAIRTAKVTAQPKPRKPRVLADRVMIEPGKPEDIKATKAGSKRHLLAEALAAGATIEELVELLGWNKDTVSSALRTDMGALGLGVERKAGKYYLLLPKGVKRVPELSDTTSAAAFGRSVGLRDGRRFLALVEAGYLPATETFNPKTKKKQIRMSDQDTSAFHREFLTLTTIATEFGISRNRASAIIKSHEAKPFSPEGQDFCSIWLRVDVVTLFTNGG